MIVIGLNSGTSADGVDAAVMRIEGAPPALRWQLLAHHTQSHSPELRAEILACCNPATATVDRICALNFVLGRAFARAALDALAVAELRREQIDLLGSHGQTIWHIPEGEAASTLQIGETAVIAELTGAPVVGNFRTRDMAVGGQGAPLVGYTDTLLLTHPTLVRAAQNIGGIANVTYLPPAAPQPGSFAFDTGPGNMLVDQIVFRATNGRLSFDRGGELAAQGTVDQKLLDTWLGDPYFRAPPPKTTGREYFGAAYAARLWDDAASRGREAADLVATVTALTAQTIARAYRDFLPRTPDEVVVSGGGALNATLMQMLVVALAPARVITSEQIGLPVEAKEAAAFAVLAYETWHGRSGNLPAATGAAQRVVLGSITPRSHHAQPGVSDAPTSLTEARNPATTGIDVLPTLDMLRLINAEDAGVPAAVAAELPQIAEAVDRIAQRMRRGGRLIYIGAGTSGRLGVLDASECPPTYNTQPGQVVGLIAGGLGALTRSLEGAEDNIEAGARDIAELNVSAHDSVVGLAASGETPYVVGGMDEAHSRGALVISVACNHPSKLSQHADIAIAPLVGPEVITGSTRMKAGTAQKMVLNMLSTGVMIRLGKTFGNLMVDVQPTNNKLRRRARRIVQEACGIAPEAADEVLQYAGGDVKVAIVATLLGSTPEEARRHLADAQGVVGRALQSGNTERH